MLDSGAIVEKETPLITIQIVRIIMDILPFLPNNANAEDADCQCTTRRYPKVGFRPPVTTKYTLVQGVFERIDHTCAPSGIERLFGRLVPLGIRRSGNQNPPFRRKLCVPPRRYGT